MCVCVCVCVCMCVCEREVILQIKIIKEIYYILIGLPLLIWVDNSLRERERESMCVRVHEQLLIK